MALFLLAVLFPGCTAPRLAATVSDPTIRVCIADRSQDVQLGIGGSAVLETIDRRFSLEGHQTLRLRLTEDGSIDRKSVV